MITQRKRVRSRSAGCFCHRYHSVVDPVAAIENAEIVIVGGGIPVAETVPRARAAGTITDVVKRAAPYTAGAQALTLLAYHSHHQRYADCRSARFRCAELFPLEINPHFTNALPEGHKVKPVNSEFANCWSSRQN
ncbi:Type 1 glutamine amidotransferase-like domain-containing protein [Shigella boydii]